MALGSVLAAIAAGTAGAQTSETTSDSTAAGADTSARVRFYATAGVSVANSYSTSNLQAYLAQHFGTGGDVGTAWGMYPLAIGLCAACSPMPSGVGLELQFVSTNNSAIETYSVTGGYTIILGAHFMNLAVPIWFPLDSAGMTTLVLEPGLDLGVMEGTIRFAPYTADQQEFSIGVGGHLAAGLDFMFSKDFGITTRGGMRLLQIREDHGGRCYTTDAGNSQCLMISWSGLYLTVGAKMFIN